MRNFYWNVFAVTGSIDAYLMYKEVDGDENDSADEDREELAQEEVH
ncbi:MAG: YqzL family protein [Planifilum fimeticola]